MALNYIEKGNGLIEEIHAAGHWVRQIDNVMVSSDDIAVQAIIDAYTLEQTKTEVKARIDAYAKSLRDKAIEPYSVGEMASWPIKRAEALSYQSSGNAADAPMLTNIATKRGATVQNIVDRVLTNSSIFMALEEDIDSNAGYHKDAVMNLTTFQEVVYYDYSNGWPVV